MSTIFGLYYLIGLIIFFTWFWKFTISMNCFHSSNESMTKCNLATNCLRPIHWPQSVFFIIPTTHFCCCRIVAYGLDGASQYARQHAYDASHADSRPTPLTFASVQNEKTLWIRSRGHVSCRSNVFTGIWHSKPRRVF